MPVCFFLKKGVGHTVMEDKDRRVLRLWKRKDKQTLEKDEQDERRKVGGGGVTK